MVQVPNYKKPPVREALIDIRVDRLPATTLPELERLHERLRQSYPEKRTTYAFEGRFEMQESSITTSQKSHGPSGYHFVSSDGKRIIQFRLDGFTFNQLKPDPDESWVGWANLRKEAAAAWEIYVKVAKPSEVSRLAVRYINQIVIRSVRIDLDDYFTSGPQIPKDFPYQNLDAFISRVSIPIPDKNAAVTITHVPDPGRFPNSTTVILDIEVFRNQKMPLDNSMIWDTLDEFRDIKNNVFEASLFQKAKDLFL